MKGSYSLIIRTPEEAEIGALGLKKFSEKYAVYNGSAFGPGGLKRVLRHFSSSKKIHWHIDYLLDVGKLEAAVIFPEKDLECDLSQRIDGRPVEDFGCSDCGCESHLFEFESFSEALDELDVFSEVKVIDRDRYEKYSSGESEKSVDDLIRNLPDSDSYERSG